MTSSLWLKHRDMSYVAVVYMTGVTEHLLKFAPTSNFLIRYIAYEHASKGTLAL